MSSHVRVRAWWIPVVAVAMGCAPGLDRACSSDSECPPGDRCVAGRCVGAAADAMGVADGSSADGREVGVPARDASAPGGDVTVGAHDGTASSPDARTALVDGRVPGLDAVVPNHDGTVLNPDFMGANLDATARTPDAATLPVDAVAPVADASSPPGDARQPPADALPPPRDGWPPPLDAAVPSADAVDPPEDAHPPPRDALSPPEDALASPGDASVTDAGEPDAEGDAAAPCVPHAEVCNGADDDCDAEVDEGVCVHCDGGAAPPCNACPAGTTVPLGWVCVPPGQFTMGSPAGETGRNVNEAQHVVTLTRGFLLKATEVTQGEWFAVIGNRPSYFRNCGENCPVERVDWYDAAEYFNRLSAAEGLESCYDLRNCVGRVGGGCAAGDESCVGDRVCDPPDVRAISACDGYRFPTEAEWEYATRAGTRTAFWNGAIAHTGCDVDARLDRIGWYCGNSGVAYAGGFEVGGRNGLEGTHPVARKTANAFGLYDVHGGVWEWTNDIFAAYGAGAARDPSGPAAGEFRTKRGGGWYSVSEYARSAFRGRSDPTDRYHFIGLRPARTLPPPAP